LNLDDVFAHLDPQERYAAASILRHDIQRRRKAAEAAREPRIIRDEKWCPRCGQMKSTEEFGISRARPDGRQGFCRACR
jgi:transposase-like protein